MGLRKAKGNMYDFVDFTWNVFKGKCEYDCSYCYMKKWGEQKPLRFDENEFREFHRNMLTYGTEKKIFVGSSCDMFVPSIDSEQIQKVLDYLKWYDNEYFFQTKNSARFSEFQFPEKSIFCVTIETNDDIMYSEYSKAPLPTERILCDLPANLMITIEPIMKFTETLIPSKRNSSCHYSYTFSEILKKLKPFQINIGANTTNVKLPEPSREEILELISECEKFTKVVRKKNLRRLLK